MPLKNYELISIFSKGIVAHEGRRGRMVYNPQGLIPKVSKREGVRRNKGIYNSRPSNKKEYYSEYTNYPKMIIEFKKDSNNYHPTQKPIALLEYLIKTYTHENYTVLDNAMGSGSTGVACVNTSRNFIGIEKNENYFNIAKERIEKQVLENKNNLTIEKFL